MTLSRTFTVRKRVQGGAVSWEMRWRDGGKSRSRVLKADGGGAPSGIREAERLAAMEWETICARAGVADSTGRGLSLRAAVEAFSARPEIAAETRVFYKNKGAQLLAHFGNLTLEEIDQRAVDGYIVARRGFPAGLTHEIKMLKAVLRWAEERGHRVKRFRARLPPVVARAGRSLTPEQVDQLAQAQRDPRLGAAIIAMAYTGLRVTELTRLRWEDIDFEASTLRIVTAKRGATSTVEEARLPLSLRALDSFRAAGPRLWQGLHRRAIHQAIHTAGKRLGLGSCGPHLLRHTFCSWVGSKAPDLKTAQLLMRHRALAMTMRYWHPPANAMRQAVEIIGGAPNSTNVG